MEQRAVSRPGISVRSGAAGVELRRFSRGTTAPVRYPPGRVYSYTGGMIRDVLASLGLPPIRGWFSVLRRFGGMPVERPDHRRPLCSVRLDDEHSYARTITQSVEAFRRWREVPALCGASLYVPSERSFERKAAIGAITAGSRQDHLRGRRRSAGDDRYRRLCGRTSRPLYGLTMPSERWAMPCGSNGFRSARSA